MAPGTIAAQPKKKVWLGPAVVLTLTLYRGAPLRNGCHRWWESDFESREGACRCTLYTLENGYAGCEGRGGGHFLEVQRLILITRAVRQPCLCLPGGIGMRAKTVGV